MQLPTSVKIHGHNYDVRYVADAQEVPDDLSSADYMGEIDHSTRTIRIQTVSPPEVLDTLIHEVLHAILHRNQTLRHSIKPTIGEEAFVATLADELSGILLANGLELPRAVKATEIRIRKGTSRHEN